MRIALSLFALTLGSMAVAQDTPTVPFYGNEFCPSMPNKKVDKKWSVTHEGQTAYFCCRKCWTAAKENPAEAVAKAYPKDKVKVQTLEKCPIMGKKLGDNPEVVVWQGYQIPFCCKRCVAKFRAEPSRHLTMILDPSLKDVKNEMCPFMTEEKVVADHFVVYKKHIVGICCDSCVTGAQSEPAKLDKLVNK